MPLRPKHLAVLAMLLSTAVLCIFGTTARSDDATPKPSATAPATVTVWYDIGDLTKPAAAPADAGDAQPGNVSRDDVRKLICDLVDTNTWKDNGGDVGSIVAYGHQLIVTQTPGTQRQIKTLLDKLGQQDAAHGPTVTVDAYWLRLTPAQLPPGQSTVAAPLLTDPDVVYARARAVGFDGQAVTVGVTRTVDVVTHATPVVAPGVSTYDLTTTPEQFGVTLVETPTHADGDSPLQLVIDSTITMLPEKPTAGPTTRESGDPTMQQNPMMTDPAHGAFGTSVVQIHTKTSVRLKPGVPTVVGGMTDHPGSSDGRTLCLVLCATVEPLAKK